MACTGIHALDPVCHVKQIVGDVSNDAFSHIAGTFGQAAASAVDWLWRELNQATSVDLTSPGLRNDLVITSAIAGVLCVGLFLIQMITTVLRREPGGLARGLRGSMIATLGSVFAIATTNVALAMVDQLSQGLVEAATGSDIRTLGSRLGLAGALSSITNPAVVLILSVVLLIAVAIVWGAMMVRKMLLIIAAVMAPLAFAGSAADITRAWVRRWIEFTAALVASKLILVVIFMTGISVLDGAGANGSGVTQTGTQLIVGALILLLGGFAPLIAIKMVHFVGDSFQAVHVQSHAARAGAQTAMAIPQKAAKLSGAVAGGGTGAVLSSAGGGGASSKPPKPNAPASSATSGVSPNSPSTGTATNSAGGAASTKLATNANLGGGA